MQILQCYKLLNMHVHGSSVPISWAIALLYSKLQLVILVYSLDSSAQILLLGIFSEIKFTKL